MTPNDHLGAKIAKYLRGPEKLHLAHRRAVLASTAAMDAELSSTSYPRTEARHQAVEIARAEVGRTEDAYRNRLATDKDVLAAKARLKVEHERATKLDAEINAGHQRSLDSRMVLDRATGFRSGLPWPIEKRPAANYQPGEKKPGRPGPLETEGSAPDIRIVQVDLPEEADLHVVVTKQRAESDRLRHDAEEVDLAPDRIDSVKRRARQHVEELAARGAPVASGAGEPGGRLTIQPPKLDIGAAPALRIGAGHIPRADDALTLVAWALPERVLEAVEASVDEAYLGVDVQLDPHERQRRKREIRAACPSSGILGQLTL